MWLTHVAHVLIIDVVIKALQSRLIIFAKDPQEETPISITNGVAIAAKRDQLLGPQRFLHRLQMLLIKHALDVVDCISYLK
jgi:hypothetical protein